MEKVKIGEHYEPAFGTCFTCSCQRISVKKLGLILNKDSKLFRQNFAKLS